MLPPQDCMYPFWLRGDVPTPVIFALGCAVSVYLIVTLCLLWRQNCDCEPDIFARGWAVFVYLIITLCLLWWQNYDYDCEPDIFALGWAVFVHQIITLTGFAVKKSHNHSQTSLLWAVLSLFVWSSLWLSLLWRQAHDYEPDIFELGCAVFVYWIVILTVFTV